MISYELFATEHLSLPSLLCVLYCTEYRDVSQDPQLCCPHLAGQRVIPTWEKPRFPMTLYAILARSDNLNLSDIIRFQAHGRSFKIFDRDRFVSEVLPRFFPNQSTMSSFQRQLNIYGFLRLVKTGPDQYSYYHEMFLRGRPDLLDLMKRRPKKGYMVRQWYDPSTEPFFYAMSSIQNVLPYQSCMMKTADQVTASTTTRELEPDTTTGRSKREHPSPLIAILPICDDVDTSSTSTRFLTSAHSSSDTSSALMAYNHETATVDRGLSSIVAYNLPKSPAAQIQYIDPKREGAPADYTDIDNDRTLRYETLMPSMLKIGQVQAAMQQYDETLTGHYKLSSRPTENHQSTTAQIRNASIDEHNGHRTGTQERWQCLAQIRSDLTSNNVPSLGHNDASLHSVHNDANDRYEKINLSSTAYVCNRTNDHYIVVNHCVTYVWGKNDVLDDDCSISDESLNRDWGLLK